MLRQLRFLTLAICWVALPASAHDAAYFDSHPSAHGGQTRMTGPYHLELLAQANVLTIYVTDHAGTPQVTAQMSGHAVVLEGNDLQQVNLHADSNSTLVGTGHFPTTENLKVVVSLQTPDGAVHQARFAPPSKQ